MIDSQRDTLGKRQLKRWQLVFYLRVFDFNSGDLVGHLVNVHTEGMMLISDHPIAADGYRTLDLQETAQFLRMPPSVLPERVNARSIPGSKAGKRRVFLEADLVAYLRSRYAHRSLDLIGSPVESKFPSTE